MAGTNHVLVAQKEPARHFVCAPIAQRQQAIVQLLLMTGRRLVDVELQVVQEQLVGKKQPHRR